MFDIKCRHCKESPLYLEGPQYMFGEAIKNMIKISSKKENNCQIIWLQGALTL